MNFFVLALFGFLLFPTAGIQSIPSYQAFNPELGILYRPPVVPWDTQQWDAVFNDPSPPMGWVFLPVGKESCKAILPSWLERARQKRFRLGLVLDPFLSENDVKNTVDCAVPLGFQRAVLDEYISYHTKNLNRPLCTVLSEVRSIYAYVKARYPSFRFDIDDSWHTWMTILSRDQSKSCGSYPYFRVDSAGISVLSKYGNPAQKTCAHPTAAEMKEQLLDSRATLKDYSKNGKVFVWQLNQNWYPGGEDVLQVFRQLKPIYGWEPFLLFGPTTETDREENWGYRTRGTPEGCPKIDYEWHLPARDYLIRMREGSKTTLNLNGPSNVSKDSVITLQGRIKTAIGIRVNTLELQIVPPAGSVQSFQKEVVAPSGAFLAFVGVRINSELPNKIPGPAGFSLLRAQLFEAGKSDNLVSNGEFNDGLNSWIVVSTSPISVVSEGSEKGLEATCSAQQIVTITSAPIIVIPGRSYKINFDARLFAEARNNGYFFVSWNNPAEKRRDRLFMSFPDRQTIAATASKSDGRFTFKWQPLVPGVHTVFAFFPGSRTYRPSITSIPINVN